MVGARSAAMAFNRIADRGIDAENPRTRSREIPAGRVSRGAPPRSSARSRRGRLRLRRLAAQPALPRPVARRPPRRPRLLVHEARHRARPPRPRPRPRDRARRRVDRRDRAVRRSRPSSSASPSSSGWRASTSSTASRTRRSTARTASSRSRRASAPGARWTSRRSSTPCPSRSSTPSSSSRAAASSSGSGVVLAGVFLVRQHVLVKPNDLSRVDGAFFTANGWLSVAVFVCGAADVFLRS